MMKTALFTGLFLLVAHQAMAVQGRGARGGPGGASAPVDPGRYVAAVRYSGQDILTSGLTVDGVDRGPMEIVIDRPTGTVSGVLRDAEDKPVAATPVALIPSGDRRGNPALVLACTTDQTGAFSLTGVHPGDSKLLAWATVPGDAYRNPTFVRDYGALGTAVTVRGGATATASLRVIKRIVD